MSAIRHLLRGAIDYAGLFPPAGLGMTDAVTNYAGYRDGEHAWALGRFVLPASRLGEFESAAETFLPRSPAASPWRVAALIGPDVERDIRLLGEFNCGHAADGAGAVSADVVEGKADTAETIARLLEQVPKYMQAYVEVPIARDPSALVDAISRAGGRAKVRTGGITPDAFPAAGDLARFIRACVAARVPFKATAGLHHPLRAEYRLTYEPGGASGTMFGFLNVFLAAAFLAGGMSEADAALLLEERDRSSLEFAPDGIEWRGHRLGIDALARARETGIVSFGSCSFTEPVGDLQSLGLL